MRVVIDTNVLISAIFWTGKPKHLLNQVRLGKLTLLTSKTLLAELKEILTRQDKPFRLSVAEAEQVVAAMRDLAEIVEPRQRLSICQDEEDNRVLECAAEGHAEWIITGDLQLLGLRSFQGMPLVTVASFFKPLRKGLRGVFEGSPMERYLTTSEAQQKFLTLIDEVGEGDPIIITKRGVPKAVIPKVGRILASARKKGPLRG